MAFAVSAERIVLRMILRVLLGRAVVEIGMADVSRRARRQTFRFKVEAAVTAGAARVVDAAVVAGAHPGVAPAVIAAVVHGVHVAHVRHRHRPLRSADERIVHVERQKIVIGVASEKVGAAVARGHAVVGENERLARPRDEPPFAALQIFRRKSFRPRRRRVADVDDNAALRCFRLAYELHLIAGNLRKHFREIAHSVKTPVLPALRTAHDRLFVSDGGNVAERKRGGGQET